MSISATSKSMAAAVSVTDSASSMSGDRLATGTAKKARKKITLNCRECVAKKLRCDRARPSCRSCIRRQTLCAYSHLADVLDAMGPETSPPRRRTAQGHASASRGSAAAAGGARVATTLPPTEQASPSHHHHDQPTAFTIYNEVSEHPFQNYWTMSGGIVEVLAVLPSKTEADILIEQFFEPANPLYPIISRHDYLLHHEHLWSLSGADLLQYDPGQLALHFMIYAMGIQFSDAPQESGRYQASRIYLSASYQSLCLSSYLSRGSIPTIQCMVLMGYYFVNRNMLSDAWTFSGIAQRQAYGLGLHLQPSSVEPRLSVGEQLCRYTLWQAVLVQDTWLSLYLQLPPASMHSEFGPSSLASLSSTFSPAHYLRDGVVMSRSLLTPHSATSASDPWTDYDEHASVPQGFIRESDLHYLQATWELAVFVREHICVPRALRRPLCTSASHKSRLVEQMHSMRRVWAQPFNSTNAQRLGLNEPRLARQQVTLLSNFFGALCILYMDDYHETSVRCNANEALDAAEEGLSAFFALLRLCPRQVDVWGGCHIRAFTQANIIGTILAGKARDPDTIEDEPRLQLAKSYLERYVDILIYSKGSEEFWSVRTERIRTLQALVDVFNLRHSNGTADVPETDLPDDEEDI